MNVINRVGTDTSALSNLGGKSQYSEKSAKSIIFGINGQKFATEAELNDKSLVQTQINEKKLVPFLDVFGIEESSTEPVYVDGLYDRIKVKDGISGVKYRYNLDMKTYNALKDYEGVVRNVYIVTEDKEVLADVQDDKSITGRKCTMKLSVRTQHIGSDVPLVNVELHFDEDVCSVLKPSIDFNDLEGIENVEAEIVSATATEIKVKMIDVKANSTIINLIDGNIDVKDASGGVQSLTSTSTADLNGVYTIVGVGFANGFTIGLSGVINQTEANYETETRTELTGI